MQTLPVPLAVPLAVPLPAQAPAHATAHAPLLSRARPRAALAHRVCLLHPDSSWSMCSAMQANFLYPNYTYIRTRVNKGINHWPCVGVLKGIFHTGTFVGTTSTTIHHNSIAKPGTYQGCRSVNPASPKFLFSDNVP